MDDSLTKEPFQIGRYYTANISTAKSTGFTCVPFSLYFHCPFYSQQMLVVSHCTLTVHQNVFLTLQFLPAILTFLLRKRLQLITCQKYIL